MYYRDERLITLKELEEFLGGGFSFTNYSSFIIACEANKYLLLLIF